MRELLFYPTASVSAILESDSELDHLLRSKSDWKNAPQFDSSSKRNPHSARRSGRKEGREGLFHIPEMFLSLFSLNPNHRNWPLGERSSFSEWRKKRARSLALPILPRHNAWHLRTVTALLRSLARSYLRK